MSRDMGVVIEERAKLYMATSAEKQFPESKCPWHPDARRGAFRSMLNDPDIHMGMLDHWMTLTTCKQHKHRSIAPQPKPRNYDMEGTRKAMETPTKAPEDRRADFPGMIVVKAKAPEPMLNTAYPEDYKAKPVPKAVKTSESSLGEWVNSGIIDPEKVKAARELDRVKPAPAITGRGPNRQVTPKQGPAQLPAVKPKTKLTGTALRGDYEPMPDRPVTTKGHNLNFLIPALAEEAVLEVLQRPGVGHVRKARGIGFQLEIRCSAKDAKDMLVLAVAGQTNVQRWENHPQPMKYPRACGIAADRIKEALRGGK